MEQICKLHFYTEAEEESCQILTIYFHTKVKDSGASPEIANLTEI
jgi:hypothetical protein